MHALWTDIEHFGGGRVYYSILLQPIHAPLSG